MQDLQQTINMVLDYVRGIWIKKRYLIICSWLLCPIGFFYVMTMPDVYKSKAVVYVDTRSMLQPLLVGISIQTNPETEIKMMAQTLLSRSNVEIIARESDLDITASNDREYNALISRLSEEIDLTPAGRNNIYTIAYADKNPQMAKTVVQETLDLFVEGSLGNNRRDTDSASRFLDEQIAEYENRLSEAEQRLADFQRQYNDILPAQGSFYSNLQKLTAQLESTELLIKEAQQKVSSLKNQFTKSSVGKDGFSPRQDDDIPSITTRYDSRIQGLEEKLDQLRLRFTDIHPEVVDTQALLDSLEKSRKKEIDTYLTSAESDEGVPPNEINQSIRIEVGRLEGEIASLKIRELDFIRKIEELRSKLDLVPQIEAESSALNRDYGITKQKYEELLSRKESAEISRRAEVSSEDLQFRIIEPPLVPSKPSGPARMVFYTIVLILAFGVGIAIAFLMSQITPILVRGQQLTNMTGFPIWGAVTHLQLDKIKRRNKLRIAVFVLSSGIIFLIYGALMTAEVLNISLIDKVML